MSTVTKSRIGHCVESNIYCRCLIFNYLWQTIEQLKTDVLAKKDLPMLNRLFGSSTFKEAEVLFARI
jgi:hypothetical protein